VESLLHTLDHGYKQEQLRRKAEEERFTQLRINADAVFALFDHLASLREGGDDGMIEKDELIDAHGGHLAFHPPLASPVCTPRSNQAAHTAERVHFLLDLWRVAGDFKTFEEMDVNNDGSVDETEWNRFLSVRRAAHDEKKQGSGDRWMHDFLDTLRNG